MTADEQREFAQRLQRQLSQISGMCGASTAVLGYRGGLMYQGNGHPSPMPGSVAAADQTYSASPDVELRRPQFNLEAAFNANPSYGKSFIDNMDFEFVS